MSVCVSRSTIRHGKRNRWLLKSILSAAILTTGSLTATAADITVTTNADSGAGSLRDAITAATPGDRILFAANLAGGNTITLASMLPVIDKNLQIDGSGNSSLVISGNNQNRAFFVQSGNVSISSLRIENVLAQGGNGGAATGNLTGLGGGGGGLGAGAAIFVDSGATVTVTRITVQNSTAQGGTGAALVNGNNGGGGGGGGFGGNGGQGGGGNNGGGFDPGSGGGGGGLLGSGGTGGALNEGGGGGGGINGSGGNGSGGAGAGLSSAGAGGGVSNISGGVGTNTAGNGGNSNTNLSAGGGGGGNGGQAGQDDDNGGNEGAGGNGGYGGGGGGAGDNANNNNRAGAGGDFGGGGGGTANGISVGGAGGFGGGGGGAVQNGLQSTGGAGGFGGGGGSGTTTVGAAGSYGGTGGSTGGGGGGALGGAFFVRQGGTLNVVDSNFSGSAVTAGAGAGNATNGQALGSTLFLQNSSLAIDVTGNNSTTIADSIADNSAAAGGVASTLTKNGTGTLNLTGTNVYQGDTNIVGGRLAVNGSIAGNANVQANGTLGGNGTVNGNVSNSGRVGAGNSIGTLHIGGNYDSVAGSTTEVEIRVGGTTPGVHQDLINVTGAANLAGGTVQVVAAPGQYTAGTTYRFLDAAGGINGTFDGASDNMALYDARLAYDPTSVSFYLYYVGNFRQIGLTPNQIAVGQYLDGIESNATGSLADLFFDLRTTPADEVLKALTQFQGQIYATLPVATIQQTTQSLAVLRDQLDSGIPCEYGYRADGYVRGYGMTGNNDSVSNASGYRSNMGGTEIGYQRCYDDGRAVGLFGNAGWSETSLRDLQERANVDHYQFGGSFQAGHDRAYLLGMIGFGFQQYDVTRDIDAVSVHGRATSNFNGWQQFDYLEYGTRFAGERFVFSPYLAAQYIYLDQGSTQESGVHPVNLNVSRTDVNSLRGFLGAKLDMPSMSRRSRVQLRAALMHELGDNVIQTQSTFVGASGPSFVISGASPGRDYGIGGAGWQYKLGTNSLFYAGYDIQYNGRGMFQTGSGGLQFVW